MSAYGHYKNIDEILYILFFHTMSLESSVCFTLIVPLNFY